MEIIAEEDIDRHQAKKVMEDREKTAELTYEQKITLEFLQKLPSISEENLKALKEELLSIAILKSRYIALISNILPDTEEEVDALFTKERTNLKKEEIQQIASIVKKHKK